MRKKIFGVAIMAAIAVTAGWNMSQNENEVKLADLALDNVEALASGESSSSCRLDYLWFCRPGGTSYGCSPCYT